MLQKDINRLHLVHLGKMLNNYAILGGVFLLLTVLVPFVTFIFYAVAIVIALFLLITVAFWEVGWGILTALGDESFNTTLNGIMTYMNGLIPYVFAVTAVFAAASIALVVQDKNNKHIVRIVFASLAILCGIISLVLRLMGVLI